MAHKSHALWNLAQTSDVAGEIAASGAVEVLVTLAAAFAGDPTVQLGVAGCLRLVCINDAAADMVVTANGLPTLFAASRNHLKRSDVQRAFVGALLELASHGFASTIVQADGIGAVLRAAEAHAKEERLQAAAGVIRLLAVDDESKSNPALWRRRFAHCRGAALPAVRQRASRRSGRSCCACGGRHVGGADCGTRRY